MRWLVRLGLVFAVLVLGLMPSGAHAMSPKDPHIPIPHFPDIPLPSLPGVGGGLPSIPGFSDCKEAPTPAMPGRGVTGFFGGTPDTIPAQADPFAEGAQTSIYEQYGYAGLTWRTYDLGCGPDVMRQPDAVVGTSVSNWIMQVPLSLTALTGSVTQAAYHPTFLAPFDHAVTRVSTSLHDSLFASWAPVVIALLGVMILFKANRSRLATTAAGIGWALLVVMLATALFRWPTAAGDVVDGTVTGTLGSVVGKLDGRDGGMDPGTAVASNIHESLLYRAWLAGELGSPDSEAARKYGADLFKAQALTWSEAAVVESDPNGAGKKLIDSKKESWKDIAAKIQSEDPEAYEYLTGKKSDGRVGYAMIAAIGTILALPFLLMSALLLIGCFLIVRLAVMLFPAFAVLGALPASRGLVTGLGRVVAAATINAIIFGIGAGITISVLGILFHPGGGAPGWLSLVLMPVFSFIMWVALKPFRRLTAMADPNGNHFGHGAGAFGEASRSGKRLAGRVIHAGIAGATGGATAAVASAAVDDDSDIQRVEADPGPRAPAPTPGHVRSTLALAAPVPATDPPETTPEPSATSREAVTTPTASPAAQEARPSGGEPFVPRPTYEGVPPPPTDPEWSDGEQIFPIYHPDHVDARDFAEVESGEGPAEREAS